MIFTFSPSRSDNNDGTMQQPTYHDSDDSDNASEQNEKCSNAKELAGRDFAMHKRNKPPPNNNW